MKRVEANDAGAMYVLGSYYFCSCSKTERSITIISCSAKSDRSCWHTKVNDGWLVVLAVLLLLL